MIDQMLVHICSYMVFYSTSTSSNTVNIELLDPSCFPLLEGFYSVAHSPSAGLHKARAPVTQPPWHRFAVATETS